MKNTELYEVEIEMYEIIQEHRKNCDRIKDCWCQQTDINEDSHKEDAIEIAENLLDERIRKYL